MQITNYSTLDEINMMSVNNCDGSVCLIILLQRLIFI